MELFAKGFKALADSTRLRLLKAILSTPKGVCVCELVDALGVAQYLASRHLGLLKNAGWLQSKRRGTWIYYQVSDALYPWQKNILDALSTFDSEVVQNDRDRLVQRLAMREDGLCVVGYEIKKTNKKERRNG